MARSRPLSTSRAWRSRISPAAVSLTRRVVRSNRRTPSPLLQLPDLLAERRLGHAEAVGGAAEMQLLCQAGEVAQMPQLGALFISARYKCLCIFVIDPMGSLWFIAPSMPRIGRCLAGRGPPPRDRPCPAPDNGEGCCMVRFWSVKAARTLLTLWFVVTFAFIVLRVSGDPVQSLLGPDATIEEIAQFREAWGLDRPLPEQYLRYVVQMASGEFGTLLPRRPRR